MNFKKIQVTEELFGFLGRLKKANQEEKLAKEKVEEQKHKQEIKDFLKDTKENKAMHFQKFKSTEEEKKVMGFMDRLWQSNK